MARMISFPQPYPANQGEVALKNWKIILKDLCLDAFLGIHDQEKSQAQKICINVECDLLMPVPEDKSSTDHVYCYDQLVQSITKMVNQGHIHLVETLAEEIAKLSLSDDRVLKVMVRVEKTEIYPNAASAGVEITRSRKSTAPQRIGE